jgi:transaldolase
MAKTKIHQTTELGQSIWLDYIGRKFIEEGKLQAYVDKGLRGVTSNPAIFDEAIANSDDYDNHIRRLAVENKSVKEMYETLTVEDIQMAADVLRSVYEETHGEDGFISLEVNPHLAHETQETISEAKRLTKRVDRPNLMIKVPATTEGIPAIQTLISEGYNINVTLMFSLAQYDLVAEAYLSGLEKRLEKGGKIDQIHSVASFFVSRVDVKVDEMLDTLDTPKARSLKGKIGIANAKMAYQRFKETFDGKRWERLAAKGAHLQRVLYGSTSTKNPDYSDTLYPDNLIGRHTINTLPPETLDAFMDHGTVAPTLDKNIDLARQQLDQLAELGIDLSDVTRQLLDEGVEKFNRPYDSLIENIALKKGELVTG